VEPLRSSVTRTFIKLTVCFICALPASAQRIPDGPPIPANFNLDLETAERLRPQLMAQSMPVTGRYATANLILDRLVQQVQKPSAPEFARKLRWELRIVADDRMDGTNPDRFNAYSSPDGTIYIETGLAQLAGSSPGLWAAILSHEIAHVARRDWARRFLYQKSLQSGSAATIVLGDPGLPAGSWTDSHWADSQKASDSLARFCRQMEIEADREGLMLMARAGYHPDFVPALHHLLHAQAPDATASLYAMHPCWEERDRELNRAYLDAGIEFERRWREWFASPGGNPPTVVFTEAPSIRKIRPAKKTDAKEWEIDIPIRCQNLVGAVEVVLRSSSAPGSPIDTVPPVNLPGPPDSDFELRQLTGCTSPRTTITFTLAHSSDRDKSVAPWTDVYVLDARGTILARASLPKLPH